MQGMADTMLTKDDGSVQGRMSDMDMDMAADTRALDLDLGKADENVE